MDLNSAVCFGYKIIESYANTKFYDNEKQQIYVTAHIVKKKCSFVMQFQDEFILLTDIAKYKSDDPNATICNWMRNKDTLEFIGLWEGLHNFGFKPLEFEGVRNQAGSNAFTMSQSKWINVVGAVGIISKSGCYGGTYAHSDIAFEFASWISAEFKLYIIKDYKRLKMMRTVDYH